jgi:hypothetical protein
VAARVLVVVGSYSQAVPHAPDAHGAGLTVSDIDLTTGTSRIRFQDGAIANPAYLCIDQRNRIAYVLSEVADGSEGTITALQFDRNYDSVVSRSELPTGGTTPAYVSIVDGFALVAKVETVGGRATRTVVRRPPDERGVSTPPCRTRSSTRRPTSLSASGHDGCSQSEAAPKPTDHVVLAAPSRTRKSRAVRMRPSRGSRRNITSPRATAS